MYDSSLEILPIYSLYSYKNVDLKTRYGDIFEYKDIQAIKTISRGRFAQKNVCKGENLPGVGVIKRIGIKSCRLRK